MNVDRMTAAESADFKRDRWGRPLVSDPAGGAKPLSYGRPSSFGDAIADKYNLQKWGKRQVVTGMARTPSLIARALAASDSKALDVIAEDALTAAKSSERADIGTALHRIIERQILGEQVELVEPYAADVAAFWDCLTAAGMTVHRLNDQPQVEVRCVNDHYRLAGTFDFILETAGGSLYLGDLKTGASLDFGHIGYAVQLAVYQGALVYDVATGVRSPLPPVASHKGIIVHLPAGTGTCELRSVDLVAGRRMADLCDAVLGTRKEKTIGPFIAVRPPAPTSKLDELCRRVDAFLADVDKRKRLGAHWPSNIPAKDRTTWGDHLDEIGAALVAAERDVTMPFAPAYTEPTVTPEPLPEVPEAIAWVDQLDIEFGSKLGAKLETLKASDPDAYSLASKWAKEAADDGHPIGIKAEHARTRKRCARVAVVLQLAPLGEYRARAELARVLGYDAVQPAYATGAIIGTLTYQECEVVGDE